MLIIGCDFHTRYQQISWVAHTSVLRVGPLTLSVRFDSVTLLIFNP
jgi:hypothetical protein